MAAVHRNNMPPENKRGTYMKPRRRSSLSGPVTFVIVIIASIFVMSVFFRVENIEVEGNYHYTDEEIIRAIDIEQGDNLFFYDRFSATSRVFAKLPYIEQVSVERSLPNKVVISVEESEALAYLELGDESWTMDHGCKILGKAAEGETAMLMPIVGIDPGTLYIGENLTTKDGNEETVAYLAEVLYQLEERGLYVQTRRIDFSDPKRVKIDYGSKYTLILGAYDRVEYKFGMFVSVLDKLLDGDVGIIDVSSGSVARFIPN